MKLDKTTMTIGNGKSATFKITMDKAAGTFKVSSSSSSIAKVEFPSSSDVPVCSSNTNKCFLDGYTRADEVTITVKGVSKGTAYINIEIEDVQANSGKVLSGTARIGVLVN